MLLALPAWFETRCFATRLTMRITSNLILRSPPKAGVSKDEAQSHSSGERVNKNVLSLRRHDPDQVQRVSAAPVCVRLAESQPLSGAPLGTP
jgi:hypothetical protein